MGSMRHALHFFLTMGVAGPLILGVMDSSFLFLPLGNDLLVVILISENHTRYLPYALIAALGSTLGVVLLDAVCRKGGEEGLKKMLKPKRFEQIRKKMSQRAGFVIALACLAPPPFPFTAVIAAASAFDYPRRRLLAIVFASRLLRYSLVGLAAIVWGRAIIRIARSSEFYWAMIVFVVICAIGSTISTVGWIRRTRYAPA
jgi:membrane protein YqaA with SNARE-associated domain